MSRAKDKGVISSLFVVPTLRRAGAETQIIDLVNGLDSQAIRADLVVFERDIAQIDRVNQSFVTFKQFVRKGKYNFSFVRAMARYFDERDVKVIHCTMQFSLLVTWLALRFSRCRPKLVVAIHTTINVGRKEELLDQLLYRRLFRACECIIFVCHSQAQYWLSKYPELEAKSTVIYNGVDPAAYDPAKFEESGINFRREQGIPAGSRVIVNIAGFRREKGHDILIDAFATLPGEPHLVLAGDGECRKEVSQKIAFMGLEDRVHFLGNIDDVRPVLAASSLSVLASTAVETFSMAMLESLSMAVPMVATDIGGLKEAILPGITGDLVPIGDADALARAMRTILEDEQSLAAMGRQARQLIKDKFSKRGMIEATQALVVSI